MTNDEELSKELIANLIWVLKYDGKIKPNITKNKSKKPYYLRLRRLSAVERNTSIERMQQEYEKFNIEVFASVSKRHYMIYFDDQSLQLLKIYEKLI